MNPPLQFFIEMSVHDGQADGVKEALADSIAVTNAHDEGVLSYQFFFNEDETKAFAIEVYTDAKAFESHMATLGDRPGKLLSMATIESITALGDLPEELQAALAPFNLVLHSRHIGGFTR